MFLAPPPFLLLLFFFVIKMWANKMVQWPETLVQTWQPELGPQNTLQQGGNQLLKTDLQPVLTYGVKYSDGVG